MYPKEAAGGRLCRAVLHAFETDRQRKTAWAGRQGKIEIYAKLFVKIRNACKGV